MNVKENFILYVHIHLYTIEEINIFQYTIDKKYFLQFIII